VNRPGTRWLAALTQILLAVGVLVGLTAANYRLAVLAPGGNDFLARWVGANQWLVHGRNPYAPEVSLEAQKLIYGRPADRAAGEDVAHFAYPLFSVIFFGPFGLIPYTLARAVWMTLLELGLPLLAVLGAQLWGWKPGPWTLRGLVLFSVLWYHGFRAVILGQFAVFEALLIVGALLAIHREQDRLAGVLIGLSLSKPQMAFLLIPFVLLWAVSVRRLAIVTAWLGTVALFLVGSLALLPSWPIEWARQVIDYTSYTEVGAPVSILAGLIPTGERLITGVLTGLGLIYLAFEWQRSLGKDERRFQWTAAVTLALTNLIALRTATTNYVVLLPALTLVFMVWSERWGRSGNLPIAAAMVGLFVGLWLLFFATVEGNQEHPALYLPVPLIALGGLWWSNWWVLRRVRP
jgi:hypothetical protein